MSLPNLPCLVKVISFLQHKCQIHQDCGFAYKTEEDESNSLWHILQATNKMKIDSGQGIQDLMCCNRLILWFCFYRIIDRMPSGNQLLLRYIICILHHINQRSEDNLMTSYNLAVCLGPSLLWNESTEMAEQEASSKTVPQVVQFLIDNAVSVFGENVLDMFGHPPIAPVDSDEEGEEANDRIHTPYNDSLESLSDTEAPMGGLTQMSPSSCSRDSGLILSDPHEDGGEQSDDHSLRQQIIKSKSCDSLTQNVSARHHPAAMKHLQTQVSSDSLNCDDEYVEINDNFNFLLTKSKSGSHLCYDKEAEGQPKAGNERLRERLASLASRYNEESPSNQEIGYSSSDSEKSIRYMSNLISWDYYLNI